MAPKRKQTSRARIRFRAYDIVTRAVDEGVMYGWNRGHKYVDDPPDADRAAAVQAAIVDAVMLQLDEVIEWDL